MVKTFFLLLLSAGLACGQAFTLRQPVPSSSAAAFTPTTAPGMAFYWNYTDLANGSVATWTDRIQSLALTQATSGKRPTKSAAGVTFTTAADGNLACTQVDLSTTSNCTVWITFKLTSLSLAFKNIFGDTANRAFFVDGGSAGKMVLYPRSATAFTATSGVYYNWVLLWTNSVAVGGCPSYTNGVATVAIQGFSDRFRISTMGNDAGPGYGEPFDGAIKFVGMWTNRWLSASEIANLNTYANAN